MKYMTDPTHFLDIISRSISFCSIRCSRSSLLTVIDIIYNLNLGTFSLFTYIFICVFKYLYLVIFSLCLSRKKGIVWYKYVY